jgi:hypothetical protein
MCAKGSSFIFQKMDILSSKMLERKGRTGPESPKNVFFTSYANRLFLSQVQLLHHDLRCELGGGFAVSVL